MDNDSSVKFKQHPTAANGTGTQVPISVRLQISQGDRYLKTIRHGYFRTHGHPTTPPPCKYPGTFGNRVRISTPTPLK